MGKFDSLEKYLGKEDQYNAAEIINALDNVASDNTSAESIDEDIDPDALANIDDLLTIAGDAGLDEMAAEEEENADIALSGQELDAIGGAEETPADIPEAPQQAQQDEVDLNEFSALSMDEDSEAAADLASLQDLDSGADSIADTIIEDTQFEAPAATEEIDAGETGMDFSEQDTTPDEEADANDIDPEVLDELQNLDTAPPPLSDIETRRYSEDLSESEEVSNLESDLAALSSHDITMNNDEPEGAPAQMENMDIDITNGSEEGEFGDLLSQMSPGTDTPGTEEALIPEMGAEMDELSDILSAAQEDVANMENSAPDSTAGTSQENDFDLEGGGFELPDFDEEGGEDLKSESDDSGLEDLLSGISSESSEDAGIADLDMGAGTELDFELPQSDTTDATDNDFGDFNLESADDSKTEGELDLSSFDDIGMDDFSSDTTAEFGEAGGDAGLGDFSVPDSDFGNPVTEDNELDIDAFSETSGDADFSSMDASAPITGGASTPDNSGLSMDEDKALRIRNRINQLSDASLRKLLRNAFLDPIASADKVEQLMAMLLLNEDEQKIYDFIAQNIPSLLDTMGQEPDDLEIRPEIPTSRPRRVIYAEDAKKAQEFQKEFQTYAKYATIALVSLGLLIIIAVKFIWAPNRAAYYYKAGLNSIKIAAYPNAESKFKKGMDVGGFDPAWFNKYALAYLEKNEHTRATNKLAAVLEEKPLERETIFNFADFFREKIYPPKHKKAIDLYLRLYNKDKEDYLVLDAIGQTYIDWGDFLSTPDEKKEKYSLANELYKDYRIKNPKDLNSRFKLLLTALRADNAEQIETWYTEIKDLNKNAIHLEILTELARYYINKREMDNAKPVLTKLEAYIEQYLAKQEKGSLGIKKELAVSDAYYESARFQTINMSFVDAITASSNAILWNTNNGLAYNLMGEIYYVNSNLTNFGSIAFTNKSSTRIAEEFFRLATKHSPGYYKPYANLGHIYYYQRNFNLDDDTEFLIQATNNYYMAKARIPEGTRDFNLQYNLAWLNYKTGNYDGAFDEWSALYKDDPFNPVLSFAMGNTYFQQAQTLLTNRQRAEAIQRIDIAKIEYDKAIDYYESIAKKVSYINPLLERHREIYMQLARSYNNRGVINSMYSKIYPRDKAVFEQRALLDFFKAKTTALKVQTKPYGPAEYNIKYTYHVLIKGRKPSFDNDIPKRTTLKRLVEEFKFKLIQTL